MLFIEPPLRVAAAMQKTTIESSALPADIAALSFEDALGELEKLVKQLEDGKAKLGDAMSAYERGTHLKRHCEAKLREAQARIEQIAMAADGTISANPFNA